ncbi:MAG: hypothetical protein H6739_07595 [Alphaproteobacteria bacterium]|nr:hypothetical protein [Alphaproteobacteria bacterium]
MFGSAAVGVDGAWEGLSPYHLLTRSPARVAWLAALARRHAEPGFDPDRWHALDRIAPPSLWMQDNPLDPGAAPLARTLAVGLRGDPEGRLLDRVERLDFGGVTRLCLSGDTLDARRLARLLSCLPALQAAQLHLDDWSGFDFEHLDPAAAPHWSFGGLGPADGARLAEAPLLGVVEGLWLSGVSLPAFPVLTARAPALRSFALHNHADGDEDDLRPWLAALPHELDNLSLWGKPMFALEALRDVTLSPRRLRLQMDDAQTLLSFTRRGGMDRVDTLELGCRRVGEAALSEVVERVRARRISLAGAPLTDAQLLRLARQSPGLQALDVLGTAVTARGLVAALEGGRGMSLEALAVSTMPQGNEALLALGHQVALPRLRRLLVFGPPRSGMDGRLLRALGAANLPRLEVLDLLQSPLGEVTLPDPLRFPALRHLALDRCGLSARPAEHLWRRACLPALESLSVTGGGLAAGLGEALSALQITALACDGDALRPEDLQRLRAADLVRLQVMGPMDEGVEQGLLDALADGAWPGLAAAELPGTRLDDTQIHRLLQSAAPRLMDLRFGIRGVDDLAALSGPALQRLLVLVVHNAERLSAAFLQELAGAGGLPPGAIAWVDRLR